jgi:hypothetical protein
MVNGKIYHLEYRANADVDADTRMQWDNALTSMVNSLTVANTPPPPPTTPTPIPTTEITSKGGDAGVSEDKKDKEGTSEGEESTEGLELTHATETAFNTYENSNLKFKIQYPFNWTKVETDSTRIPVIFTTPKANDTSAEATSETSSPQPQSGLYIIGSLPYFLINVENTSSSSADNTAPSISSLFEQQPEPAEGIASLNQFALIHMNKLFNSSITQFQLLEKNSAVSLTNGSAYKLVYNGTKHSDSTKVKGSTTFTIKDGKAYSLQYLAQAQEYDKYLPLIQNMTNSFQLISNKIEASNTR